VIYVVFLRISHKKREKKKMCFPLRLHSAPQIQIESSYFYKLCVCVCVCVCDGVTLALEAFGVDTSAGRVGRT